jgi:hypothetical protein
MGYGFVQSLPSSIPGILDDFPMTLDETYQRMLKEIPEEKWKYTNRLLQQGLLASLRPLRVEELQLAEVRFASEKAPEPITS